MSRQLQFLHFLWEFGFCTISWKQAERGLSHSPSDVLEIFSLIQAKTNPDYIGYSLRCWLIWMGEEVLNICGIVCKAAPPVITPAHQLIRTSSIHVQLCVSIRILIRLLILLVINGAFASCVEISLALIDFTHILQNYFAGPGTYQRKMRKGNRIYYRQ